MLGKALINELNHERGGYDHPKACTRMAYIQCIQVIGHGFNGPPGSNHKFTQYN